MANKGRHFEESLKATHDAYLLLREARVDKVPTAVLVRRRFDPKLGRSVIVGADYPEKTTCDFVGVTAPGVMVAFEAKHCENKTSFRLDTNPRTGWGHEVEYLRQVHQLGGVTFVLIEHYVPGEGARPDSRAVYLVPGGRRLTTQLALKTLPSFFELWDSALQGGRKSIPADLLRQYPLVTGRPMRPAVDWLTTAREIGLIHSAARIAATAPGVQP